MIGIAASLVAVIPVSTSGTAATCWLFGLFEQAIARVGYFLQSARGFHHGTRGLGTCILFGREHLTYPSKRGEPVSSRLQPRRH